MDWNTVYADCTNYLINHRKNWHLRNSNPHPLRNNNEMCTATMLFGHRLLGLLGNEVPQWLKLGCVTPNEATTAPMPDQPTTTTTTTQNHNHHHNNTTTTTPQPQHGNHSDYNGWGMMGRAKTRRPMSRSMWPGLSPTLPPPFKRKELFITHPGLPPWAAATPPPPWNDDGSTSTSTVTTKTLTMAVGPPLPPSQWRRWHIGSTKRGTRVRCVPAYLFY